MDGWMDGWMDRYVDVCRSDDGHVREDNKI